MKLRITAVCDIGNVRGNNEDMVLVGAKVFRDGRLQGAIELDQRSPPFAVAVADGIGGANAGGVAAQIVLEQLSARLAGIPPDLDEAALRGAIDALCLQIHRKLLNEGVADAAKRGMGATLVGLLYYQGRLHYISAGDSRLYRFRDATLMRVSQDHSLRDLNADGGLPSNVVFNAFGGGSSSFYVDVGLAARRVLNEDVFLLCSDGLSDMLADDDIEGILSGDGREEALLAAAMRKGGLDNISYVLVEAAGVEET